MARDAVFTEAVSATRSKGRAERDPVVTMGKSRFALCKELNPAIGVIQGPQGACSLKATFSWPAYLLHGFLEPASGSNSSGGSPGGRDKKEMLREGRRGRVMRGMGCDPDF